MKSWRNSIGIIIPYFGKLPWYYGYFIHSCKYNLSVHFFIITDDNSYDEKVPENIFIIHKTFEEVKTIISEKLQMDIAFDDAYKLCDFKPAYGFIFSELLANYDFWGHGDIDVVYGNIRGFMTNELLNNYDIISSRHDYITGTFCLFRNSQQMNTLFMQSKDYKKVFSSSEHFCFDECNFLWKELESGIPIFDYPDNIQSMTWVVKKAEAEGKLKAFFDFIIVEGTPGKIKWDKGKIIYRDMYEAMFYHLVKFKFKCKKPKVFSPIPDIFYFTPSKILIK